MAEALKSLLFDIRQHSAFKEFLSELRPPPLPRYRRGDTLEEHGAKSAHASGMWDQYDRLHALLTGENFHEKGD